MDTDTADGMVEWLSATTPLHLLRPPPARQESRSGVPNAGYRLVQENPQFVTAELLGFLDG
ncbi:hypothetical protein [Streptomyces celluloflavus]|uniref:Uncharacterized protein n=1 Tax=Streptomyces celluloflavus TaxID=58344 RepID=A0ABW7RCD3_9ACTN|nr:hypothetical protein OG717_23270 [Streptomyces celluloflavus]